MKQSNASCPLPWCMIGMGFCPYAPCVQGMGQAVLVVWPCSCGVLDHGLFGCRRGLDAL